MRYQTTLCLGWVVFELYWQGYLSSDNVVDVFCGGEGEKREKCVGSLSGAKRWEYWELTGVMGAMFMCTKEGLWGRTASDSSTGDGDQR